jgi:hypothetical protein
MKKLTHFATALAKNTLSISAMTFVKGGADSQGNEDDNNQGSANAQEDEKRRERPGGGISTN